MKNERSQWARLVELALLLLAAVAPQFLLANQIDADEFVKGGASLAGMAVVLGVYKAWKVTAYALLFLAVTVGAKRQVVRPSDSPFTVERVALGTQLFFDPRLSASGTVSCATCHQPTRGWTDGRRVPIGGTRNAPTLINAGFQRLQFHDGRADHLEGQALLPLQNRREMGPQTLAQVEAKLNGIPGYRRAFTRAFGGPPTATGVAQAIASFERTIVSYDAPIDRYLRGETWAMNRQQKRGFAVFKRSRCDLCHVGPDFRDGQFHHTGTSMGERDQGRFTITRRQADFKAFKTATLREVGRTAPYFHNGRAENLGQVVDHYDRTRNLFLSAEDRGDLEFFLRTGFLGKYPQISAPKLPR